MIYTRDNMDEIQIAADDKMWAEWFQFISYKAVFAAAEDRPAIKDKIDFMAKRRMIGTSFDDATEAYARGGVA